MVSPQAVSEALPQSLLQRLRCPSCLGPLERSGDALACEQGHRVHLKDGYVDLAGQVRDDVTRRTLESFGYEWNTFEQIQPEDEEFWAKYFADVPLHELEHRIGVDIGCGKGRYTTFTALHLEGLIALDGSAAVVSAARNLAGQSNVVVVKADLRHPPLAEASFGFVSCLGVLHHLEDPEEGFRDLVRLLDKDGILLLYLYSRPEAPGIRALALWCASVSRRLTVRLSHRLLRGISAPIAFGLHATVVTPGRVGERLGWRRLSELPLAEYRGRPLRSLWLDTFDRLSAPVETRYVWAELEPWFHRAGLRVEAVRDEAGFFIVARRPPG